jgi:putative spermidine/putrescine transport system permease protein
MPEAGVPSVRTAPANHGNRAALRGLVPALPALVFTLLIFAIPILILLARSVTDPEPGFGNYALFFSDWFYFQILWNTFFMSGCVTLVCLLLAYPLAWALLIMNKQMAQGVLAVVVLSAWTSLLAKVYALLILLQDNGAINLLLMKLGIISSPLALVHNFAGVIIGMSYIMLPYVVLPIHSTLSTIDPVLLQAASTMGAKPRTIFFRIMLPMSLPGISTGCILCFVLCLGYFVVPAILGSGRDMLITQFIFEQVRSFLNWGMGSAAAFILLLATFVLYALYLKFVGLEVRT